jgi:hypothetical protein
MSKKVTIAAGYVSDEALLFLEGKGARIDSALGISMIELPENAEICKPGYQSPPSEYAVQWADKDGNDPDEWIEVQLCFDVNETTVYLRKHVEEAQRYVRF